MAVIRAEHELHRRRLSRNIGLGVTLIVFVVLVYSLTVVKVGHLGEGERVMAPAANPVEAPK